MNRLLTDNLSELKEPCNYTETVDKEVNEFFNLGIEADPENMYNEFINQRQFSTMPNNMASSDQKTLRDWLYKTPLACEDNSITQKDRTCGILEGFSDWGGDHFEVVSN